MNIWAVGTRASTTDIDPGSGIIAPSQASLGGVYKLVTVGKGLDVVAFNQLKDELRAGGQPLNSASLVDKIKISGDAAKTTLPGMLGVVRMLTEDGKLDGSVLVPYLAPSPIDPATGRLTRNVVSVMKRDPSRVKTFGAGTRAYDPHRPLVTFGQVAPPETIHQGRQRGFDQMQMLSAAQKRLINPAPVVVGVEEGLYRRQQSMINAIRAS